MRVLLLLLLSTHFSTFASSGMNCGINGMMVWTQTYGMTCVPRYNQQDLVIGGCFSLPITNNSWMNGFPPQLFPVNQQPWWASQGHLYYPNVNYPGPWNYPGIQARYYPGEGQVFAAKPNVYIDSIHSDQKFSFEFVSSKKPQFLATTPVLEKQTWQGKIVEGDKFEVQDVNYDYLFYDVRLPQEKMQFEHGVCATREDTISWMLKDLTEMNYSKIAIQDFEEHWRVKIPDYPFYCIYPQYNRELDPVLPVEISLSQSTFIRSLYVLVPHKKEPDTDDPQVIPFPSKDPREFRPVTKIKRENMFREWGVAFLGF